MTHQAQTRYEGSILHAKCSEAADALSIRREIGDKVDEVDHAIHVLMAAGMSSPALREIARSVDIEHAAFPEIIGALFLLGPFATDSLSLTVTCLFYYGDVWYRDALTSVSILLRIILFALLWQSDWDENRFILKVMIKFLFLEMLCWMCLVASFLSCDLSVVAVSNIWLLMGTSCLLCMLSFALLGIRGTARLPCGLKVLQIFFSRGNTWRALMLYGSSPATYDLATATTDSTDSELSDADTADTNSSGNDS